jgi:hypothetical protein
MSSTIPEVIAAVAEECRAALSHCESTAAGQALPDQAAILTGLIAIHRKLRSLTHRKAKHLPPLPKESPGSLIQKLEGDGDE